MTACRLLMLVICLTQAADFTFIVTQSPDLTVASGGSVSLQCDIAELYSFCSRLVWLKLDRKKPMRLRVTDRAELANPHESTDASWVNVCQATILEATLDDSGLYYCVLSQGRFAHVGNGTRLTVTEPNSNFAVPSIDIITPTAYGSMVPLLCYVSSVSPTQAHIYWMIDGRVENGWTDSALEDDGVGDPRKRFSQNQVLVLAEDWEKGIQCSCMVEVAGQRFAKTLQRDSIDHCFTAYYIYSVVGVTSNLILLLLVGSTAVCLCKNAIRGFPTPPE